MLIAIEILHKIISITCGCVANELTYVIPVTSMHVWLQHQSHSHVIHLFKACSIWMVISAKIKPYKQVIQYFSCDHLSICR